MFHDVSPYYILFFQLQDYSPTFLKVFVLEILKVTPSEISKNPLLLEPVPVITAKPKAHAFKNEMCFPLTKTKCELKKHPNSKFECFFNDFNRTKTSLFLPFPSKLIQDNLVCVLELQE